MSKLAWQPWHKVVKLREEIKERELSLAFFAADIYDVVMNRARPVYQDAKEFFSLTYPTYALRELAKEVVLRLAGKSEKAIRQLELTYGGGKTHALITLYHLVAEPEKLLKLHAAEVFLNHIGFNPPKSRVAVLAFDKLDVEKGMEVRGPQEETRWLKNPWSVLAFQLAGSKGLQLLNAEGKDAERESAPAENLLIDLLSLPEKEKLSTLILIDEVLMFAREKIGFDPAWRSRLTNFFQYLTQAAVKVPKCAIVASLLATDPRKSDTLGKEIMQELYAILLREREEVIQPVSKDDVAEILCRRFFTLESVQDRNAFRAHVVAALKGITTLDEQTKKEGSLSEERFLKSYPFHPDLTDVFYAKWTNLEGFQRTRGILRIFALALREAENWDETPLVSVNVFLNKPDSAGISEAARELTTVAAKEEYEGKRQEWEAILQGELEKAREIQKEFSGVRFRELEQAVFATFLHSQPVGQKAATRDLMLLIGHARPDKIELERGLRRWADISWFLDELDTQTAETGPDGTKLLPKSWRLGSKPNLIQMHSDACKYRVSAEAIDVKLIDEIARLKSLASGASAAGAKVHTLPRKPSDIEDDGEFHYAVMGPKAASDPGKPSSEAKKYIDETTSSDRPRVNRNAVVLAVPSRDGLEAARNQIGNYLGWEEVQQQLKEQEIDPVRQQMLASYLRTSRDDIPEAIRQAYCLAVTVSDRDEIQAIKITVGSEPLFQIIKADKRVRITETAISAEALLPGGPYDLWRDNEESRRVKDLVGAFAQRPHLPKMLNRKAILDTLVNGCEHGIFVLRFVRPDRTVRTYWFERAEESVLTDSGLEAVLPEKGVLTHLSSEQLCPGALLGLWTSEGFTLKELYDYFSGERIVKIKKEGFEEPVAIPKAEKDVIDSAVREAVKQGKVWLLLPPASIFEEEIPSGLLMPEARLLPPPDVVPPLQLLPERLPEAWEDEETTALAIFLAISKMIGKVLPWSTVRDAISSAIKARLFELCAASAAWPCSYSDAQKVKLCVAREERKTAEEQPKRRDGLLVAEAHLRPNQIQDLADQISEIRKASAGCELKFHLRIELESGTDAKNREEILKKINHLLSRISEQLILK